MISTKFFFNDEYGKNPEQQPVLTISHITLVVPRIGEKVVIRGVPCTVVDVLYVISEEPETNIDTHILIDPPTIPEAE